MSVKLLNEACFFQCTGNPLILVTVAELGNYVAKDRGKKILTDKARCMVKAPLPCSFQPTPSGAFLPCQVVQTAWMGINHRVTCSGNGVLTTNSFMMCGHGGKISPVMSPCISGIGAFVSISDRAAPRRLEHTQDAAGSRGLEQMEQPKEVEGRQEEAEGRQEAAKQPEERQVDPVAEDPYARCDYQNCGRAKECGYYNCQPFVNNDAGELRKNFQEERKAEWQEYNKKHCQQNAKSTTGGWRIAAHHIISGNQVLMMKEKDMLSYGVLAKLAVYYGYDINNATNCIMLPTNERDGFGEREAISKMAGAFDVMGLMDRQWHVGGHKYSLQNSTMQRLMDYYEKHPGEYPIPGNPRFFSDYRTAMKEEMDKLLGKYNRKRCWEKQYKKRKQDFKADMDAVSRKVERYLLAFEKNPKKSFPYYVSKVAVEYAFDLPSASKIIAVYQKDGAIRAKRVRMERYQKDGLQVIPKEQEDILLKDRMEFIKFCQNAMHFLIEEGMEYQLPFEGANGLAPAVRRVGFGGDVIGYLVRHGNEVLAFINQNERPYQPIAKVVSRRGGM